MLDIRRSRGCPERQDKGLGCTGFSTVHNPLSPYIALPISIRHAVNLKGFERVTIQLEGRRVRGFLADKGPDVRLARIDDCSPVILLRCLAQKQTTK